MANLPPRKRVAVVALVVAIAAWLVYAYLALQPDSGIVRADDRLPFWILLVVGLVLDAAVTIRSVRSRIGLLGQVWLGFRALLAAVGILYATLPSYAIALVALSRGPRTDTRTDPTLPHPFRPISSGWFGALTPLGWSQTLLGASQVGATRCVICDEDEHAPIHGEAA